MKLRTLALTALMTVVALTASTHAGKYVGIDVGRVHFNPKGSFNDQAGAPINGQYKTHKTKMATTLNILYGCESMQENGLSLGWEVTAGTSLSGTDEPIDADGQGGDDRAMKIRQQYKFGAYGLVGKSLSQKVTLYGKLGLVLSKFRGQGFASNLNSGATGNPIVTRSQNLFGIEPGFRLKVDMTDFLSAKLDVNYALYQRSGRQNFVEGGNAAAGTTQWLFNYAPRMFGVTAGICYKL